MAPELARRLFTVDDYYRMAEAGILHEDDRVELIEGEIVEMPPIGSFHASIVDDMAQFFAAHLTRAQVQVRIQNPIRLSDFSEPQPDLALLRPRADRYREGHPGPEDVLLLVEISSSSTSYDRQIKLPLYAREGIAEFWLVDLEARTVEVYREPTSIGYRISQTLQTADSISPLAFPDLPLEIKDILG